MRREVFVNTPLPTIDDIDRKPAFPNLDANRIHRLPDEASIQFGR